MLPPLTVGWASLYLRFFSTLCWTSFYALELALLLALLAWVLRVSLLPLAVGVVSPVELSVDSLAISLGWHHAPLRRLRRLDSPIDTLSVSLRGIIVFSPLAPPAPPISSGGGASATAAPRRRLSALDALRRPREALARVASVRLELRRAAPRYFIAVVWLDDVAVNFIGYDRLFKDTNLKRLADAVALSEATRPQPRPRAGMPSSPRIGIEVSVASFTGVLEAIVIRKLAVNIERNVTGHAGGALAVLPQITMVEERLEPAKLEGGLTLGLLRFVNGIAFRTIASTSIDVVRHTLGYATTQASAVVTRSLDLVDAVNRGLGVPGLQGGSIVMGATDGVRVAIGGAFLGTRAVVDGAAGGAKEIALSLASGSVHGVLRGLQRGVSEFSRGVETGAYSVCSGATEGSAAFLSGVDCSVSEMQSGQVVSGVTGGARLVATGFSECAVSALLY